jgi:hypothetical protein
MADQDKEPNDLIKITCFDPSFNFRSTSTMESYKPVCFTKILGVNDDDTISAKESMQRAVEENPRNGSLTIPPAPMAPGGPLGLAMMTRKFWRPGRELKIGFQGGSQWQKVRLHLRPVPCVLG